MSYLTTYFYNTVIDTVLRGGTLYGQKHVGDPTDSGTAFPSTVTTRDEIVLSAAAGGATTLTAESNWTSTDVETITHISIWDAATAGHCLAVVELSDPVNCGVGDTLELSSLAISFKGA